MSEGVLGSSQGGAGVWPWAGHLQLPHSELADLGVHPNRCPLGTGHWGRTAREH